MKRLWCWILIFGVLGAALPPGAAAAEQEIPGKSALLMDIATGKVLFEKNAHEALAPASVTKVMTYREAMYEIFQCAETESHFPQAL